MRGLAPETDRHSAGNYKPGARPKVFSPLGLVLAWSSIRKSSFFHTVDLTGAIELLQTKFDILSFSFRPAISPLRVHEANVTPCMPTLEVFVGNLFKFFLFFSVFSFFCNAMGGEISHYYAGEAIVSKPNGEKKKTVVILLEKTELPEKSRFIERAISVEEGKEVTDNTMVFDVSGSNFQVRDNAGFMSGNGILHGEPWNWTYFKATMKMTRGNAFVEIEDFMADKSVLVARKKVFASPNHLFEIWDVTLNRIPKSVFDLLAEKLK